MAYAAWNGATAHAVGDIVRATTPQPSGLVFRAKTSGTTGQTEPKWPTDIGNEVDDTDGSTITWAAISSIYEELSVLAPSAIIEMFELHLTSSLHGSNDVFRWHSGVNEQVTGNIVWNGNTYNRIPVKAEGFEYRNTGSLPRPTLTVANLDSAISALLLVVNATSTGNDLAGAEVRRIRTVKKFLDAVNFAGGNSNADPYATMPEERYFIDRKASENRDAVVFELASKFDLAGQMIPKRQCIANICQWEYRSEECSYAGNNFFRIDDSPTSVQSEDACGKRISSCKKRFGENGALPFGSFPGVGLTQ
jgi:lambda family phage minor tail protein L